MSDDLRDLRDRLAVLCGWEQYKGETALGGWHRQGEYAPHPFPPNDLTALAAAWPDDAKVDVLCRPGRGWCVVDYPRAQDWSIVATWYPTRYEAELRWLVARRSAAVLEAERGDGSLPHTDESGVRHPGFRGP